jgi:hypothetical protein
MSQSPMEKIEGPPTLSPKGQFTAGGRRPAARETSFVLTRWPLRDARMLREFQTKLEFPNGVAANDAAGGDSSPAIAAARQRETYRIMEALVREYLNSFQHRSGD